MKKRMTALLLSACMCAGLAGCGTNTPGNNPGHTKTDSSVTSLTDNITVTSVKTDITSFDQLKNGINEFSMNMYSALPADENIFYSPYSISSALSMLDVGANGATKKELENALGITDLDEWNAEMKTYLSKDWSQNTFVNTANSVWMNKDTSWSADIEKDFLTPAKDYYSGEVYEADFNGQPDKVVQNVNNWSSSSSTSTDVSSGMYLAWCFRIHGCSRALSWRISDTEDWMPRMRKSSQRQRQPMHIDLSRHFRVDTTWSSMRR